MNRRTRTVFGLVVVASVLLMNSWSMTGSGDEGTRQELVLRVGAQDDTKSRNVLAVSDMWSRSVLFPIYSTVALFAPQTLEILPYLVKGIDADDDGIFEQNEYGEFVKQAGSNRSIVTAYYDFNEVYFHDGVQVTIHDLLFSYHMMALDTSEISLFILKDKADSEESNYSSTRWLWMYPVEDVWDPAIDVGANAELTFALRFDLQGSYYGFAEHTLGGMKLLPRHLWEGTGKVCRKAAEGACQDWDEEIHQDFGIAYDPIAQNGVPSEDPDAFHFALAESWLLEDDLVIGTGPFMFGEWNKGVTVRLDKFESYYAGAEDKNRSKYLHQPYIDGIFFKIYKTAQATVFSLQAGEIDVISWSIPPEFVPALYQDPHLGVGLSPGSDFTYLGYHMNKSPFGYPDNGPTKGDDGLYLRKAIAHVIDKDVVVTTLLQDFGFAGDQPVHPMDILWYNGSVQRYEFDLDLAKQILDNYYTVGGHFADPPRPLGWGNSGYRNLPTIDDQAIDILCPQPDYDPVRASACNMIAANMREVGINARGKFLAMGEVIERLMNRVYEMWVLPDTTSGDVVEYYYATFHSSGGNNFARFQNETFDRLVEEARVELDTSRRIHLAKQCSGTLADALPYDVLYFRSNVEPYRSDRFVNWTMGKAGSIFRESFWSLIGIHPPIPSRVRLSLTVVSAMRSGTTTLVMATVRDLAGSGISGADVEICVGTLNSKGDPGNLKLGSERGECVSGLTDVNGDLRASYEAPTTFHDQIEVYFSATSSVAGLGEAEARGKTTVYPEPEFLSVKIEMIDGDIVFEGSSLRMSVEVTDWEGSLVTGSVVVVESSPEGLDIRPTGEVVLESGAGLFVIRAPPGVLEEDSELLFSICVTATRYIYTPGWACAGIIVLEPEPSSVSEDGMNIWRLGLACVMLGAAIILAIYRIKVRSIARRKRKNDE